MPTYLLTETEARALYNTDDATHDFDHVLRVARMALRIARFEQADEEIVWLAALLHDLPVSHNTDEDARVGHHIRAAEAARTLLLERGMDIERVELVVHAIRTHRFRDQSIPPTTLEAKILFDADKLDSMGAIGIARAYAWTGAHNNRLWTQRVLDIARDSAPPHSAPPDSAPPEGNEYTPSHEYVFKLNRLMSVLHTNSARMIGMERHEFMQTFFQHLDREMAEYTLYD